MPGNYEKREGRKGDAGDGETLFSSVLWGGMSVVMMITATKRADSPASSFMLFRLLFLLFLILDLGPVDIVLEPQLCGGEA